MDALAAENEGDARLMVLVAAEDRHAQRTLALRLMARVRRVVSSILRDKADREDAVQLGLMEVFRSARDYRGDAPVERWADRIVVHAAFRIARGSRRAASRIDPHANVDDFGEVDLAPTSPAAESEGLEACLEQLPEACRSVLVLRHVLGYSVADIATLTEVSPNTVKDRLVRGREMLRKLVRRARVVELGLAGGER